MKVSACFAISIDGKLSDTPEPVWHRMGSDADLARLKQARDEADAILVGGKTFRAYPRALSGSQGQLPAVHAILTRGENPLLDLPPDAPLFVDDRVQNILVFSYTLPVAAIQSRYPSHVHWHRLNPSGSESPQTMVHEMVQEILHTLSAAGCNRLLIEGGGEVFYQFLAAQAVETLYLTICPHLLGGKDSPSLLTGKGFMLEACPTVHWQPVQQVGNEVFLTGTVDYRCNN